MFTQLLHDFKNKICVFWMKQGDYEIVVDEKIAEWNVSGKLSVHLSLMKTPLF